MPIRIDLTHPGRSGLGRRRCGNRTGAARVFVLLLWLVLAMRPADADLAVTDADRLCDRAALRAALRFDVPYAVLQAITRTETGRQNGSGLHPWPWTVNMEGQGTWFATQDAARAYVFQHFKRGARSFDVGCFQINFKWHGAGFQSIDDMFDPQKNADYAAAFLKRLHGELGNWSNAAGAYHSRTPEFANRYAARFDRIRAALSTDPQPAASDRSRTLLANKDPTVQHAGRIAPLIGSGIPALGSLVPISGTAHTAAVALIALK